MTFLHDNMHIRRDLPHEIRAIENTWIPLSDGTHLAARIWLPVDAERHPVPALLEYLPYRKNDGTAWRDSIRHPYLAGHGYAAIRVDVRGNGDSDGIMLDEYTPQELAECVEVMAWLEAQPWCTGKVGMFGKSWGGFNALQVAALRPPQLKAIITIASTDDRYADDVHYMGGCVLASEMLSWASVMLCYNASPPDPLYISALRKSQPSRNVGERWRELWQQRLEETPPYIEAWLAHQRRGDYWKHGSVCENYSDIECAVYAVGSWADGYTNAVPRLLQGLSAPRKGLLGPWAHNFPENSAPGPAIGFLQESLRWWDHWLKGIDTGIMDEPMLRTWIENSYAPSPSRNHSDGKWVADPSWPSPNISLQTVPFAQADQLTGSASRSLQSAQFTGVDSGRWLSFGDAAHAPVDQRADNGRSICFTTDPQTETTILGFPQITLTLEVDQPQASLAVRLCDVAPDGTTTRVTWGLFNLCHRDPLLASPSVGEEPSQGHKVSSFDRPAPVPVNTPFDVTVPLNVCGHQIAPGHRWQIAISTTYWPHLWPSPVPVTLTVHNCALHLPIRTASLADAALAPFQPPECAPPLELIQLESGSAKQEVRFNRHENSATIIHHDDSGTVRFPDGLVFSNSQTDEFTIVEGDPLSASVRSIRSREFTREDWHIRIETESTMTCDAESFYLANEVQAFEEEMLVFERLEEKKIPRDFQ